MFVLVVLARSDPGVCGEIHDAANIGDLIALQPHPA